MAAKRTPGMDELDAFVDYAEECGVQVDEPRKLYRLCAKLLSRGYELYQKQFARAPRKDKGEARKAPAAAPKK